MKGKKSYIHPDEVVTELTPELLGDLFGAAKEGPGLMEEIAAERRALDCITSRVTGPKEKAMAMAIEAGPGLTDGMNVMERPKRQRMEGFPVRPMHDFIYVADLGQPNLSQGGVWLPDEAFKFARYKHLNERYGIVCAIGPGRWKWNARQKRSRLDGQLFGLLSEGLKLGSTVMFNRRFGSRFPLMFQPPDFAHPLYVRVLDPVKTLCLVEDFEPWWDIERGILHPDLVMSG